MSQSYDREGVLIPLTTLKAGSCFVSQVKTKKGTDGYSAVQLVSGSGEKRKLGNAVLGILRKGKIKKNFYKFMEAKVEELGDIKVGSQIKVDQVFKVGDLVDVVGTSKGRGFAGVIKRWGFHSQPKTRGQSDRERAPGSIGPQTPGRVIKGKKMPGHYGNHRLTVKNLLVVYVDGNSGDLWLKGAVPGHYLSWVFIKKTGRKKDFVGLKIKKEDGKKLPKKEKGKNEEE